MNLDYIALTVVVALHDLPDILKDLFKEDRAIAVNRSVIGFFAVGIVLFLTKFIIRKKAHEDMGERMNAAKE